MTGLTHALRNTIRKGDADLMAAYHYISNRMSSGGPGFDSLGLSVFRPGPKTWAGDELACKVCTRAFDSVI